jgi:hypothetical protein
VRIRRRSLDPPRLANLQDSKKPRPNSLGPAAQIRSKHKEYWPVGDGTTTERCRLDMARGNFGPAEVGIGVSACVGVWHCRRFFFFLGFSVAVRFQACAWTCSRALQLRSSRRQAELRAAEPLHAPRPPLPMLPGIPPWGHRSSPPADSSCHMSCLNPPASLGRITSWASREGSSEQRQPCRNQESPRS